MLKNAELQKRIAELEEKLNFLINHRTLTAGISGELIVSELVNGIVTAYATAHDIVDRSGRTIEVKYSRLNRPSTLAVTTRWAWAKVFGESGRKAYDFLLLVGDPDERWRSHYKDPNSPFIFFCIPREAVDALTMSSNAGRSRAIQLTTNPLKARSRAAKLFAEYQVTRDELQSIFGV
ncbi:MAG: hypothetical protein WD270_07405 [Acetobacterales bacterium]